MADLISIIYKLDGLIFSLLLSAFILYKLFFISSFHTKNENIFKALIISNIIAIILEIFAYLVIGKTNGTIIIIHHILNMILYFLAPFIGFLWSKYTFSILNLDEKHYIKQTKFNLILLLINMFLLLINPITKWHFTINQQGAFSRGPFFILISLTSIYYICYSSIITIIHKNKISIKMYRIMMLYIIAPLIGAVIQSLFSGVLLSWSFISITFFYLYLNIQNLIKQTDYLTNILNRLALNKYLKQNFQNKTSKFNAHLIDIDNFKNINDTFGHSFGDNVLKNTAQILIKSFSRDALVARYGGDEFIVIENSDHSQKNSQLTIENKLAEFNKENHESYQLHLSIGSLQNQSLNNNMEDILRELDKNMYQNKRKKMLYRRSEDRNQS